jgi:hypothetical protein
MMLLLFSRAPAGNLCEGLDSFSILPDRLAASCGDDHIRSPIQAFYRDLGETVAGFGAG